MLRIFFSFIICCALALNAKAQMTSLVWQGKVLDEGDTITVNVVERTYGGYVIDVSGKSNEVTKDGLLIRNNTTDIITISARGRVLEGTMPSPGLTICCGGICALIGKDVEKNNVPILGKTDMPAELDCHTTQGEYGNALTLFTVDNGFEVNSVYINYVYSPVSAIHRPALQTERIGTFSLDGKRICQPQKGFYIKNGRKYIAK